MELTRCQIKDLGRVVTGHTPPTRDRTLYGNSYPLIKPTDMCHDERYIGETMESLSVIGGERYKSFLLPPDIPCVVTIGTIGKLCLTRQDSFCNQAVNAIIVDRTKHDPLYVYYLMRLTIPRVKSLSSGTASGRENVSKGVFESIEVLVHSLPAQNRIGLILSAYDDLIENNSRRIRILEQMAKMIYREWLVNFRFPGHEKAKLVETEMGLIPKGWEASVVGGLASEIRNSANPADVSTDTPYVGLEHIPRKSIALSDWGSVRDVQSTKLRFNCGDILFGKIRPYFHKVVLAPVAGVCSSDAIVIVPNKVEFLPLVLCCVSSEDFVAQATQTSQGTKMPRANWDVLTRYSVSIPEASILSRFNDTVRPMIDLINKLVFQNRNLRQTRDLLLPKLISGEIDVQQLEEEAVAQGV